MKANEIRIRQNGNKWKVCEYKQSDKGIHPTYCSRILLDDCESLAEAEGAKKHFENS